MSNASALLRSLLAYGICLPLAVFLGFLLADPLAFKSLVVVSIVVGLLAVPLLLRWHHPWLIATWNMTAILPFVPGHPPIWMTLAVVGLTISIAQYTLNRNMKFLSVPSVAKPLLLLIVVILVTARLTGGLGSRVLGLVFGGGGDTYGGRKYFTVLAATLGYFAIISRRIPPKRAGLYVALFFLGYATWAIGSLPGRISSAFNFLFLIFPVTSLTPFTEANSVAGPMGQEMRVTGLANLGVAVYCMFLARYGIRGVLDTTKPWRLGVFVLFLGISAMSGFRSTLILLALTFALLFYLERLHQTRLLLPVVFLLLTSVGLAALFAPRLPYAMQRTLSIVPFIQVDPVARMEAASSTEWRLKMWRDLYPQVPQHLLVGKGYSFSATEQYQVRRLGAGEEGMKLVGDYHNGPLSVIIPFGIFGAIAFAWLLVAGIRVVYQNYQFGDPAYHDMNAFLFAFFVAKVIIFLCVFGALDSDLAIFLGLIALSISLNGGVAKPVVVPQPKVVFNRFKLHPSVRRPAGA